MNNLAKRIWKFRFIYLLMLPGLIGYIIFNYIPMGGVILAFKDYYVADGILKSPWVGLKYFKLIFSMSDFYKVLWNTLIINIERLIFGFPAPIILAIMIYEVSSVKFKKTVQTLVYLPHFISWVVIAGIITALLSSSGVVNTAITKLGFQKINFLTNPSTFRPLIIVSGIWKTTGWGTIIYLAALAGINTEIYESAYIDGATKMQRIRYITLPLILPTVSVMLILNFGQMMYGGFDQIYNLYNSVVYDVGDVLDTYLYRVGLTQGRYEMATAVGLFTNLVNMILLVTVNKVSKTISGTGIY